MGSQEQLALLPDSQTPPRFCQYASGECDQNFSNALRSDALFLYPSAPAPVAHSIEGAALRLNRIAGDRRWKTWKDLEIPGQIIFCEVCKAIRFSKLVVADVTTLNFNLLFEIGYAVGLGVPVLPVRDTSNVRDAKDFEELGLFDTLGYFDYSNSSQLADGVLAREGAVPLTLQRPSLDSEQPLYVVKGPFESDGMIKLMSVIKKSRLRFRTFDAKEVARISVHEAYKQTVSSRGVIVHLLSPDTRGADIHNARCAFIAGLAMASQKHVAMLQQGNVAQPIDYRDVVLHYGRPGQIPDLLIPVLGEVIEEIQTSRFVPTALKLNPLQKIDLGDLAAENEIRALASYFVPTAEYEEVKRGHARLVVGRKGSGKTALFYSLRSTFRPLRNHVVLDLKPEGHQFLKLREAVLAHLPPGVQQHVLTAFWNYLLVMELAHQIVHHESSFAYRDLRLKDAFQRILDLYGEENATEQADFSERLLELVDRIIQKRSEMESIASTSEITRLIHEKPIRELNDALAEYLGIGRRGVWMLFDNLDKGWPIQAVRPEDILLLRALLEATRKLQRQFANRNVEVVSVVFIRNDIHQHLLLEPADRGKETPVLLDWNDRELLKDVIGRRIAQSSGLDLDFDEIWATFFAPHVRGEDSFQYILNRTLMRPREVLRFVRECINTAVNRRHETVAEGDFLEAEETYSADALVDITLEMKDVKPEYGDAAYAFIGCPSVVSRQQVEALLGSAGVKDDEIPTVINLLLWFGLLGIFLGEDEERYSYQYEHDPKRMLVGLKAYAYCIHPAFRVALACGGIERPYS
jgi:hypothetical protein